MFGWMTKILKSQDNHAVSSGDNNCDKLPINLIATIPRSGTWYTISTIFCYTLIVSGRATNLREQLKQALSEGTAAPKIGEFWVMHAAHPNSELGVLPNPHYNNFGELQSLDVKKTVLIVRDKPSQQKSHWTQSIKAGRISSEITFEEFSKSASLSYDAVLCSHQENGSLIVKTEDLVAEPFVQFKRLIDHCVEFTDSSALEASIKLTTKENLIEIEKEIGKSIAGREGISHIQQLS